jgi:eukaryotic-like serine/threonine-protein kinase
MALRRPIKIGKYEVVDLLGKGGMGVVYKATDPHLGRLVAIKMMTTVDYVDNPDLLQRFYREAQSTGNLHHRNIVTVYELGDQDGSPYLVMEYLEGESLDAIITSRRPFTLLEKISLITEVCDGLAYAHQRSVVHRDIKPGNIMVLQDSGVKIVDFGIAHIGNRTVTRTGQLLGSLPYMSPEQISGRQVDARTDIFSLGVVLYQLLTLNLPFEGDTPAATLLKIIHDAPRPLAHFLDSFPPEMEEILLRALAKSREERYNTVQDLAFDLVRVRERIQQEVVDEHLHQAESLLAGQELLKAKEQLHQVLKIDRHNARAVELLRTTQQRIQQQEMGEQVRQLRGQAEQAYQRDQFALALELIQRAINLHSTDPDLQRFRVNVQHAKTRADDLQRAMERAEAAYQQGELDSAKQAIEEALALAPDDVQAKSLYRAIQRDWTQREQRRQVYSLIEEARKEIAARHFTVALEVLRKAEEIDPTAPHLQALINAAQSAREQERRRKELENFKREIEADLDRDDFQAACSKAEAALDQFPDERSLQKLKDLAEKQRALAERKYFIEQQVAEARKLLEAGRHEEVLQLLQVAQQKVGGDSHLESLLVIVRETIHRQRAETQKAEYLRRAKDLLRRKEYAEAVQTLEAAQVELGTSAEIDDLLQFTLEQSQAEKRRQIADAAAEQAQVLVKDEDYEKAVEVLEAALREAPDEELRLILVQVRHAATDHQKMLEDALANAQSMMQGQRPTDALKYLESQPHSFSREQRFLDLLAKAREQSARLQCVEHALEKARVHFARDEFDPAQAILADCVRTYGRTPELNKLVAEIEERQAQAAAETVEKALAEGRRLINSGHPGAAFDRLGSLGTIVGMVPQKLSAALKALQQEAAAAQARKYKHEAEQHLHKGEHAEAAETLQRAQAEFSQNRDLQLLRKSLDQAIQRRTEAQRLLVLARELFRKGSWHEGGETCLRAGPLSSRDPVVHKDILETLEAAAAKAVESEWRSAEFLLKCMSELQPDASRPVTVQAKVAQAKQDEVVLEYLAQAKRLQGQGDLEAALQELSHGLELCPNEERLTTLQHSLQELRQQREERTRAEREREKRVAFVAEIQARVRRESHPQRRISMLQAALQTYPDETTFEQALNENRELWQKVSSLADQAKAHEHSHDYETAIQSWLEIRELDVSYHGIDSSLDRLRRLQSEAKNAAKNAWLKAIQDALTSFNYDGATALLADAQREFAGDKEVSEIAQARDQAVKRREENVQVVREAQNAFRAGYWQQGSELLRRCTQRVGGDPVVASQAFAALIQACESALGSDLPAAEMLLHLAAELQPISADVSNLRASVIKQKREASILKQLAEVNALAEAGDLERAMQEIKRSLANNPSESRLVARKNELEHEARVEREARERRERLAEILELAQQMRSEGDLTGSLRKIEEGLQAFPGHSQIEEMKRAVQLAIREREEKQRHEKEEQERLATQRRLQEEKQRQEEKARRELQRTQEEEQRKLEEAAATKKAEEEAERQRKEKEEEARRQLAQKKAEEAELGRQAEEKSRKERKRQRKATPLDSHDPAEPVAGRERVTEITRTGGTPIVPVTRVPAASRDSAATKRSVSPVSQKISEMPPAQVRQQSLKLYLAIAASSVIVAILAPVLWRSAHRSSAPSLVPIQVGTTPPGATVRVQGTDQECVTPNCNLRLAPGRYEMDVELSGFQPVSKSITVVPDQNTSLLVSLVPNGPAQGLGATPGQHEQLAQLEIRSGQPGAEVFVDKQAKGKISRGGSFSTQVPAGSHKIQVIAKNQVSGIVVRNFSAGGRVELNGSDLLPRELLSANTPPNPEASDWQQVKDSHSIDRLEGFLKRYPTGTFSLPAQTQLEDLYWARTTRSDNIATYNEYLAKYPSGKYSQEAQSDLTKLEWRAVENTTDPATLEDFLRKHPSGNYHDKAAAKLDDLAWERTAQNDTSSLRAYLQNHPNGRHFDEAQKKMEELNRPTQVAHATPPRVSIPPPLDDKKAVLDVMTRYQRAYQDRDIRQLQGIWPGMTVQQIKSLGDFFKHASMLTLNYRVIGDPIVDGDQATVKFTQSLSYVASGKPGKDSATVVMQLKKLQGNPGNWRIDSIR